MFTHQYMAVIGDEESDRWKKYVRLCKAAYNTLRVHSNLFINLFHMMLSTGCVVRTCVCVGCASH